jgi:DNA-directed RNA polymerase subunit RPC12/RpoP
MLNMTMQIHCPGCDVRLEVPADSGGRAARCPACGTKFRVPDPKTMLDETVTCWLNLDHLHEDEESHDQAIEEMGQRIAAEREDEKSDRNGVTAPPPAEEPRSAPPPPPPDDPAEQVETVERTVRRVVSKGGAKPSSEGEPKSPVRDRKGGSFVVADAPTKSKPIKSDAAEAAANANRPFLSVNETGAYGVKFAFESRWLDSLAFRASMPIRGMVSDETDQAKLIARPLGWVDKATGHFTNIGELEARYELHVRSGQTAREVTKAMSTLDELPPPFNQPMPYYVSRADAGKVSVHCETVATPKGVRCEVTIPSLRYALEWLGRVNGVCGEDYAELEAQTLKFEAEAWRAIPQSVRHRLAAWFDFEGDEKFLGYFNDSDFSKSDAGLAGMVMTTRRLVFCRYHFHGSIGLGKAGTLQAVEDGLFATMFYKSDGSRKKLIRLRREDVDQLADLIAELDCTMEMVIESAPKGGYSVDGAEAEVDISE